MLDLLFQDTQYFVVTIIVTSEAVPAIKMILFPIDFIEVAAHTSASMIIPAGLGI